MLEVPNSQRDKMLFKCVWALSQGILVSLYVVVWLDQTFGLEYKIELKNNVNFSL